jgi:hypothetical protein
VTTYWFRAIFAAAALGCAVPAQAQMFEGLPQQIAMTNLLLQPAIDSAKRAARGEGPAPTRKPRAVRPAAPAAVATTQYRSSPAVTARVRRQFADWLKSRTRADPAQSRQIEQALGGDFVGQWSKAVSEDGLRAGDAADALGAYWLLNWMIANGRTSNTGAEARAVRDQSRRLLAANPQFAALGDAQRQEMAEIWMLNFLLHSAAYSAALTGKDANMAGKLGEAASARFRNEMGVDLRRLRITPSGFVPA